MRPDVQWRSCRESELQLAHHVGGSSLVVSGNEIGPVHGAVLLFVNSRPSQDTGAPHHKFVLQMKTTSPDACQQPLRIG